MTRTRVTALALAAATLLALAIGGCSGGVDSTIPFPVIAYGSDVELCTQPDGTATITIDDVGTRLVNGFPWQQTLGNPPIDHVVIVGTTTGLVAGDVVWLATHPLVGACPFTGATTVTVAPDGSFSARVDTADFRRFRAVAVVAPGPVMATCDSANDCLTIPGIKAASQALEVRLQ